MTPRILPCASAGCASRLPKDVRGLIFDFDGTIADTTQGHEQALAAALRPHGVYLDGAWYRSHVGLSIHDLLAALPGAAHLHLPAEEVIRASRTHLLARLHTLEPVACVIEVLRTARRLGLRCAVASTASRALVAPGLTALGLDGAFTAVVTREDAPRGKPAPDLYLVAADRLGLPPCECLAIDDAPAGLASARAAGMRVLTVTGGHVAPAPHAATPTGGMRPPLRRPQEGV
ncbi:HAD family hydrolase [Microlunatus speluncae]|uniref:HAD family hydrolase n=1 Tax=Microlunatus speluncae TaxID=2594267 RepID=UPI0012661B13